MKKPLEEGKGQKSRDFRALTVLAALLILLILLALCNIRAGSIPIF